MIFFTVFFHFCKQPFTLIIITDCSTYFKNSFSIIPTCYVFCHFQPNFNTKFRQFYVSLNTVLYIIYGKFSCLIIHIFFIVLFIWLTECYYIFSFAIMQIRFYSILSILYRNDIFAFIIFTFYYM